MSISNIGNGWEYGTVEERLNETAYPDLRDLPEYYDFARLQSGALDEAPYPAFVVGGGHEIHLQPRQDHLIVWLTAPHSSKILVEGRVDAGIMLSKEGPRALEEALDLAIQGHGLDLDVPEGVKSKAREVFTNPFDPELRRKLRRPTSRALSRRLRHVETEADHQYDRTLWTVTIAPGPGSVMGGFEETYTTSQLFNRYPGTFPSDYNRQTREKLYIRNSTWYIWFDLSLEWIRQAAVRSRVEGDIPDLDPGVFRWRETESGVFHLYNTEKGKSACGHSLDDYRRTHDFELGVRPPSTSICVHCSAELKRLHAAEKLEFTGW